MPNIADQIRNLQSYDPSMPCAVAFWQPDDVKAVAKQRGLAVTDEQVEQVLDLVHDKQDCEYGISWTTLDVVLDLVLNPLVPA